MMTETTTEDLTELNAGDELTFQMDHETTGKVQELTGTVADHPYMDVHDDWMVVLTDVTRNGTIRVAGGSPGSDSGHVIIYRDGSVESRPCASRQIHIGDIRAVVTPISADPEPEPELVTDGGVDVDTGGEDLKAYDIHPGQVYRTALGERVEVIADDGPHKKPLKVRFPERDPQLDADGEEREDHIQFMSRYSFADAGNYEGYTLISEDGPTEGGVDEDEPEDLPGEWTEKTPRCPRCGAFMSTGMDGMGLPAAGCTRSGCGGYMDDRELIDGGYFRED